MPANSKCLENQWLYTLSLIEEDVLKVARELKNKNSSGLDGIPNNLVKHTINLIVKPLTHIINVSISDGVFPDKLKVAKVCPIYKNKGSKEDKSNYRPISLISVFSKIFEMATSK